MHIIHILNSTAAIVSYNAYYVIPLEIHTVSTPQLTVELFERTHELQCH